MKTVDFLMRSGTDIPSLFARMALGIALYLSLSPALHAQTLTAELSLQPNPLTIWKEGIGSGFREDTFDGGFSLGCGFGTRVVGSPQAHDLFLGSGSFGWVFSDFCAPDKWWRGNWEWLNELFSGVQVSGVNRYVVGWTTGLRYSFATGTRSVPFIDGGVGLSGTDIGRPDLGQPFEFNVQVGIGTHYFFRENVALTLQYRWLHFSDGGISDVNRGVNTQMLEGGLTWFL
jgi:opacity protein-like surface antigen